MFFHKTVLQLQHILHIHVPLQNIPKFSVPVQNILYSSYICSVHNIIYICSCTVFYIFFIPVQNIIYFFSSTKYYFPFLYKISYLLFSWYSLCVRAQENCIFMFVHKTSFLWQRIMWVLQITNIQKYLHWSIRSVSLFLEWFYSVFLIFNKS